MAGSYKGKIDSKTRTGGFKGQNVYRADEKKANMLKMLTETGNAKRNKDGKIVKEAAFQSKDAQPGRVQADRRWFGESPPSLPPCSPLPSSRVFTLVQIFRRTRTDLLSTHLFTLHPLQAIRE